MKTLGVTILSLFALALTCRSQLMLNSGDVWTYQFTSLPLVATESGCFSDGSYGSTSFNLSGFEVGSDLLRIEMFENSLTSAPIYSALLNTMSPPFVFGVTGAWDDLQGVVRFTMFSGSVSLDNVTFSHYVGSCEPLNGGGGSFTHSLAVMPVPEPATWSLLALGSVAFMICRRRRKDHQIAA